MVMFHFYTVLLLLLVNYHSIKGITHPNRTQEAKPYMVYLTKADQSEVTYDNWICGGAIVSHEFILTSAACIKDVQFMYAIAGYKRYLKPGSGLFKKDACISKSKKKIVFTCLPKEYNFTYDRYENWAYIDIALAKVESPYNFENPISKECSWIPHPIEISYNYKHMEPGTDAIVLGWGSSITWRNVNDTRDYNIDHLQYAPVLIQNKRQCKQYYELVPQLFAAIDKYMICTMGGGNLDDVGKLINRAPPIVDGCSLDMNTCVLPDDTPRTDLRLLNYYANHRVRKSLSENLPENKPINNTKPKPVYSYSSYGYTFPHMILKDVANNTRRTATNLTKDPGKKSPNFVAQNTRRHGFCQNDHGGPLVTWVGGREILIGIASVFLVRNDSCVGPYLYTSTNCNGGFLGCVLQSAEQEYSLRYGDEESRRFSARPEGFNPEVCKMSPKQRGFDIERRTILWAGHPDGPAENEVEQEREFYERPQIPLYNANN